MFYVYRKRDGAVVGWHDTYQDAWDAIEVRRHASNYAVGFDKSLSGVWSMYATHA